MEVSILTSPLRLVLLGLSPAITDAGASFNPHQPVKAGASIRLLASARWWFVSILTSPLRLVLPGVELESSLRLYVSILTSPLRLVLLRLRSG